MGWLPGFFGRKKSQHFQQPLNDPETKSLTITQVLVEETIMACAQWLITFVNRTIQHKQNTQNTQVKEETVPSNQAAPLEELLLKFSNLVEKLHEREQGIAPLHNRISEIEASLKRSADFEQYIQTFSQTVAVLEKRLIQAEKQIEQVDVSAIEAALQRGIDLEQRIEETTQPIAALEKRLIQTEGIIDQVDSLVKRLDQTNQNVRTLENRIQHLEKLLAQFSIIPKLVEGNYRAIISMQKQLESSNNTSKKSLRIVSK